MASEVASAEAVRVEEATATAGTEAWTVVVVEAHTADNGAALMEVTQVV